mmetsp:Transcript_15605/g.36101  ORF Transcript_15605/g.36101 Transcript_15605/m.36101 type:complete len:203 (+) Transcript_15605:1208-1816(+)
MLVVAPQFTDGFLAIYHHFRIFVVVSRTMRSQINRKFCNLLKQAKTNKRRYLCCALSFILARSEDQFVRVTNRVVPCRACVRRSRRRGPSPPRKRRRRRRAARNLAPAAARRRRKMTTTNHRRRACECCHARRPGGGGRPRRGPPPEGRRRWRRRRSRPFRECRGFVGVADRRRDRPACAGAFACPGFCCCHRPPRGRAACP